MKVLAIESSAVTASVAIMTEDTVSERSCNIFLPDHLKSVRALSKHIDNPQAFRLPLHFCNETIAEPSSYQTTAEDWQITSRQTT